ncbi:hypothetical protein ACO0LV_01345 [Pseudactinotalea sp. Z1739]|uniref:hypothetical protein n=1 Tax=Pseudactinotalea sp. Z1739 TaxID=3413028 RepID=UPI003C7CC13D
MRDEEEPEELDEEPPAEDPVEPEEDPPEEEPPEEDPDEPLEEDPGMVRRWPMRIRALEPRLFAEMILLTLVPWRFASAQTVSPARTVCVVPADEDELLEDEPFDDDDEFEFPELPEPD